MTTKHTPEPWEAGQSHYGHVIKDIGRTIATIPWDSAMDRHNARRIVAAINATAGISTEALEAGMVGELVDALSGVVSHLDVLALTQAGFGEDSIDAWSTARAVLAKVKP